MCVHARTPGQKAVLQLFPSPCSSNTYAQKGKRKTLTASDVFSALQDMEFEQFIPELKECLEGAVYRTCANFQSNITCADVVALPIVLREVTVVVTVARVER